MFKYFLLILFIGLFSCTNLNRNKKISDNTNYTVNLTSSKGNISFNKQYTTIYITSLNERFPNYYKSQLNYKGFNKNDSIIISTLNTDYKRFYFDLYKQGFITIEKFLRNKIDSVVESKKTEQKQLLVAINYTKNKQILVVDENYNKDFSDDKAYIYEKGFRHLTNDSVITTNLPLYNFNIDVFKKGIKTSLNRKVIIYPSLNNIHFIKSDNEILKKSQLILKLRDFWKGKFNYDNNKYEIAVQGFTNSSLTILVRPDSLSFSNDDAYYNENFAYKIKDTLVLSNQSFVIDSISIDIAQLFLSKTSIKPKSYGYRIGNTIENFELENLQGLKTRLYDGLNKKYTLLDFWGTWCKPCRKLTPSLKNLNFKLSRKLEIISIAYDDNLNKVIEYTLNNDMNWSQNYLKRDFKKWPYIITNLKIKAYPTFILIDENKKIIYRGTGKTALETINQIIEK